MLRLRRGLLHTPAAALGGGVWTPAQLFDAGQQGAYYDASTGVFEDTGAATPSVADAVAGRINDLSGNGLHMLQATAANKPLRKNSGSLWWLETDASNDFMASAASMSLGPVPVYIFAAIEKLTDGAGISIFGAHVDSTNFMRILSLAGRVGGQTRSVSQSVAQESVNAALNSVPINTKTVVVLRIAAGTSGITLNGGAEVTAANSWAAQTAANCGVSLTASSLSASSTMSARFYAGGVIGKNLSAGELASLKTWLGTKVSLTL